MISLISYVGIRPLLGAIKLNMCIGIILKDGTHLQSVRQVEMHFDTILKKNELYSKIDKDSCLCQVYLREFMEEDPRKSQFEYDCGEYWER